MNDRYFGLSPIDQKNAQNLANWTLHRALGSRCPDLRGDREHFQWTVIELMASRWRGWAVAQKRELDRKRAREAAERRERHLCRVIAFPLRRSR